MDIQIPQSRIIRKKARLAAIACLAGLPLILILVVRYSVVLPTLPRQDLWIGTVHRGQLSIDVRADGRLEPSVQRWISSDSIAEVARILVEPGTPVNPGTVLMTLVNNETENQLLLAKAAVAEARANLAARRTQLESELLSEQSVLADARAAYASADLRVVADAKAASEGVIPKVEYQQDLIELTQLKYRVHIDRKRIEIFRRNISAQILADKVSYQRRLTELALAQEKASALIVRAGSHGVVQEIAVQEGQRIASGTNLARVADPRSLIAVLYVSETHVAQIVPGMKVRLSTNNEAIFGQVTRIDPVVKNGRMRLRVKFNYEKNSGLQSGASINGRITITKLSNVLWIHRSAFAAPYTNDTLFRLSPNGRTATRVLVRLGKASISRVQVLSGLRVGQRVILSGAADLAHYTKIRIK
jgi:RND family efflux transporter MFP subunit